MARERMASVDTAWLRMDTPRNRMMIVGVKVFDAPPDPAALRAVIGSRLLAFCRFRQRAELHATSAWWVDDEGFDLDAHLLSVRLPAPGDDAALKALVGELASTPLDPARPLWQFHLVTGYRGGGALVARIHHCIADGIALVGVLLSLTDQAVDGARPGPGDSAEAPVAVDVPERRPQADRHECNPWRPWLAPLTRSAIQAIGLGSKAWSRSMDLMVHPERAGDYATAGVRVLRDAASIALMSDDTPTCLKGRPGPAKQVAWGPALPLDDMKAVGRVLGASVNDVLLSCVAGALRRYLLGRGMAVRGCELRAMVPVNLREPGSGPELGNRFGLVPLVLPVGVANPVERLAEVRRRMGELKGSYQAILAYGVLGAAGMMPRIAQTQLLDMLARKATSVMTNVPGPREPLYLAGARIRRLMFWVPQSGDIGLGVSILSYAGGVQFGVMADAGLTPDPQAIVDGFEPEFDRLVACLALLPPEWMAAGTLDPAQVERAVFATPPVPASVASSASTSAASASAASAAAVAAAHRVGVP